MNAKKHTGALRAILVALSVVSMLMTGLFVVNSTQAGADPIVCPDGFSVTQDQKSCYATPVVITKQAPPACVDADGNQLGHITPNNKACIEDVTYLDQDPIAEQVKIAADSSSTATTYTCPIGWSGPDAKNNCSTTSPVDDLIVSANLDTPATKYTCTAGTLVNGNQCSIPNGSTFVPGTYVAGTAAVAAVASTPDRCPAGYTADTVVVTATTKCFVTVTTAAQVASLTAAGGDCSAAATHANATAKGFCSMPVTLGTPGSAAVAAVSATCNGVATTQPASACGTTQANQPTVVDATAIQGAAVYSCPAGFSPVADDASKCRQGQANQSVTRPADPVAGTTTTTCPEGFSGPTSEGYCTRTELTAQKQIPTCERGTLLRTGNDFVCLLDNTPVYPEPTQAPECPRGTYDAKTDLCFVPATVGTHSGSVTVVPKTDAQAASGSTAPAPAFTG